MSKKYSKGVRLLDIFARLCEGRTLKKREEAVRFGVDERSIQRDIADIRGFLAERSVGDIPDARSVEYDQVQDYYVMTGAESSLMCNSEILAVSKILLESRAFTKTEMNSILDKLLAGCVPRENLKLVADLIANERYHYVELHNKSYIQEKLWEIGNYIRQCMRLEIVYQKQDFSKKKVCRVVEPVGILFSEYYFYLSAYIVEPDERGTYVHKYDYPAIFRIDRIKKYEPTGQKFNIAYANRFKEGEFRKRIQFMYAGKLMNLQFRYTGANVEAILDRLPTAKAHKEEGGGWMVEAEVYGKGILMWLLSQGSMVEVLRPQSFREEMKQTLRKMLQNYETEKVE